MTTNPDSDPFILAAQAIPYSDIIRAISLGPYGVRQLIANTLREYCELVEQDVLEQLTKFHNEIVRPATAKRVGW